MQNADQGAAARLDASRYAVGVVQARFNAAITDRMAAACIAELKALETLEIRHVTVPGALEIPQALAALAETRRYDALVAIGCVIRGETYHFELVANQSAAGVTRVALDHTIATANAILTVENEAQAWARAEDKAREAARVAIEMATLLEAL